MCCYCHQSPCGGEAAKFLGSLNRFAALTQLQITTSLYNLLKCIHSTEEVYFPVLLLFPSPFHFEHLIFFFRKYVLSNPGITFFVKSVWMWCIWDPVSSKSSTHVRREEGDKQSRSGFHILVVYNDYMERYHLPSLVRTATTSSSVENIPIP